jgi:hypothetical protein
MLLAGMRRVARWFFQTKTPNLGKFWSALDWKRLINFMEYLEYSGYFMAIWYILCSFGTFSGFGIMYREKSGNPGYADIGLIRNRLILTKENLRRTFGNLPSDNPTRNYVINATNVR